MFAIIIIIIIMSCRQHGYPWPSLATSPHRSSPLAGLQGYIPYPHRADVCMFELLLQQSTACLLRLTWIVFVMGSRWPYRMHDLDANKTAGETIYIYIYIYISSCRAINKGIPDPLSPLLPIVHRLWQVFRAISRILTELLYVYSSWSYCFCSAICGVHRSTSLMSSSLLLQPCPACLVRLTWIVFVMGGRWQYRMHDLDANKTAGETIYIYIYIYHLVVSPARVYLTLSRQFSRSFIASGESSGLHPVSSQSCCMYVRTGRPAFVPPYVGSIGVHQLWAHPCFSSRVLHVWFVQLG